MSLLRPSFLPCAHHFRFARKADKFRARWHFAFAPGAGSSHLRASRRRISAACAQLVRGRPNQRRHFTELTFYESRTIVPNLVGTAGVVGRICDASSLFADRDDECYAARTPSPFCTNGFSARMVLQKAP